MIEEQMKQNLTEHRDIKTLLHKMDNKLDDVIRDKADKSEVDKKVDKEHFLEVKEKILTLNKYLVGAGGFIITLLIGIIGYLIANGGI